MLKNFQDVENRNQHFRALLSVLGIPLMICLIKTIQYSKQLSCIEIYGEDSCKSYIINYLFYGFIIIYCYKQFQNLKKKEIE